MTSRPSVASDPGLRGEWSREAALRTERPTVCDVWRAFDAVAVAARAGLGVRVAFKYRAYDRDTEWVGEWEDFYPFRRNNGLTPEFQRAAARLPATAAAVAVEIQHAGKRIYTFRLTGPPPFIHVERDRPQWLDHHFPPLRALAEAERERRLVAEMAR